MTSAAANTATIHSSTSLFRERAAIIARVVRRGKDKFESLDSVDSGSGLVPGDDRDEEGRFVAYIDGPRRGCDDLASCRVATPRMSRTHGRARARSAPGPMHLDHGGMIGTMGDAPAARRGPEVPLDRPRDLGRRFLPGQQVLSEDQVRSLGLE